MLKLDANVFSEKFIYSIWFLMSFQAGYVNVGGFYESGNFVSHVTGTSSQIGINLVNMNWLTLFSFIIVLLAFIGGAAFASYYIEGVKILNKSKPRYTFVLYVKAIFFGLIFILSSHEWSEVFSIEKQFIIYAIIFLLSFCCGVQNSTCAIATGGFLKPTHMTGLSTDIGIFISKIFAWRKIGKKDIGEDVNKHKVRIGILCSFIAGGFVASIIFSVNGHYGFLFPFISSICFLTLSIVWEEKKHNPESFVFKTAQKSIFINFALTILVCISALF